MKKQLTSQGKPFNFTRENLQKAEILIARYPQGRQASTLVPLLDLAQRQASGWLPREAIEYVADYLKLSFMQVYEVATFYSMFNLSPVGKYFIQVCTTTSCQLRGAQDILKICHDFIQQGNEDNLFSVCEVECLAACVNAPMVQINDDYYEDLDAARMIEILLALKAGKKVNPGSQVGRQGSAPERGSKNIHKSKKEPPS